MEKRLFAGVCLCGIVSAAWCAGAVETVTISADAPAFVFSPGNWVGDSGRGGHVFRQSWNPGAYFRVAWESDTNAAPTLLLDTSTHGAPFGAPRLAYCLDGIWCGDAPCAKEIPLVGARPSGRHQLTVFLKSSAQMCRWGSEGVSGSNVVRVTGLRVSAGAKPLPEPPAKQWALIVGDSITEGVGAYELECYSHLVGEGLREMGLEYGLSACGWSGWLHRGDNPPGDVPGYYVVSNAVDGAGGQYFDALSRWNKIDSLHSLLDAQGRISAYGETGQEPALILINYGTNDAIHPTHAGDVRASMAQALVALRKAAPEAHIVFLIPFGQYKAAELRATVDAFLAANPREKKVSIVDLGADSARSLTPKNGYWGGLHPNPRAHATFAARILAHLVPLLNQDGR